MKFNFPTYHDEDHYAVNHPVLVLNYYQVSQGSKYGKIDIRPAYLRTMKEVPSYEFYGDHTGEHILSWFSLWGQFDWLDKNEERDVYAERLGYYDDECFNIIRGMDRVSEKVAFLRKIDKALKKLQPEWNTRFSKRAYNLGKVMGVKQVILRTSSQYDYPKTYKAFPLADIESMIENIVDHNSTK